jgi:DNA mismatch endonuclease, patch repair protein
MDHLSKLERSKLMSKIRGKNTNIEKAIFALLRKHKIKFTKHYKDLPGTPDIVFVQERLAVFIDGDFWHGYKYSAWESKLTIYWKTKIRRNMLRDRRNFRKLRRMGWKVKRFWGHQVKKDPQKVINEILILRAENL